MESRKKILVVDDMEESRVILCGIFAGKYETLEAENGREAIRLIEEEKDQILIILLDVIMPVMDGFGVLEYIRDKKLEEVIPVVLITVDSSMATEHKGYDYNVADFLQKPFDPYVVSKRVENLIELYEHKRKLELTVEEQMKQLEQQYFELQVKNQTLEETKDAITDALSSVVEFRNNESGDHIRRIKGYIKVLAQDAVYSAPEYNMDQAMIEQITKASAMHDIGKIAIPDRILLKPGRLTKEEFEIMKTHTTLGCEILQTFDFITDKDYYRYCYEIARYHHERWDGKGYPEQLKGDEIPIAAQLASVADVYDALVSKRVYKGAYKHEEAVTMIMEGECGCFNPKLLQCLKRVKGEFERISRENA